MLRSRLALSGITLLRRATAAAATATPSRTAAAASGIEGRAAAVSVLFISRRLSSSSDGRSAQQKAEAMSIQASIEAKLQRELQPTHMQVMNESHMHNVPPGSETHFKVVLVSDAFEGKPLLGRHRAVNALLDAELKGGVHALSIVAKSPKEWAASAGSVPPSPACRGGSKHG